MHVMEVKKHMSHNQSRVAQILPSFMFHYRVRAFQND